MGKNPTTLFQVGEIARGSSLPVAELGRQIEPGLPATEVEVLSRVRTSLVIVEDAVLPGMMLGRTLLHQKRVVVTGDWPLGAGHLVLINAKCSAPACGGGASVLEVDEEAYACRRRAYSDSSLERAVELCAGIGAMGLGQAYAGIKPVLKVEWMPRISQILRLQSPQTVVEGDICCPKIQSQIAGRHRCCRCGSWHLMSAVFTAWRRRWRW